MRECDCLIVGAGIAGASLAHHLAGHGMSVLVLEREEQPGYHSTGRSAAVFTENYGPRLMRVMSKVSAPFMHAPPEGFTASPLLSPLGVMFVAGEGQMQALDALVAELGELSDAIRRIDLAQALELAPVLAPERLAGAAYDPQAMSIDVHAVHTGYLRAARAGGVQVVTDAGVEALARQAGKWRASTRNGDFAAPLLVNAAGAWADELAAMAGVRGIALVPKRRTAIVFDPPAGADLARWSAVLDCQEQWYYKPDAGQVLASPADETPVPPQDVQPEDEDVALLVERLHTATTMRIRRLNRKWAGLRSFVADKCPVVGFAPDAEGFFWLAGQGGYGIQTSWAMGLTAASLLRGDGVPAQVAALGVGVEDLGAGRLWR